MDIPETDNQKAEGKENPKADSPVVFVFPVLKVHKIENFFVSDFGICVISFLVMY